MTQEEKERLLMDLCARLGYNVKVKLESKPRKIIGIVGDNIIVNGVIDGKKVLNEYNIDEFDIKPYLRLMSSMTEEEDTRRCAFLDDIEGGIEDAIPNYIDWLNSHHFDYRGLIEKGIALEAPEGMYN